MTNRHFRVVATGVLSCGLAVFAPANGRAQDNHVLPLEKTPDMTLTGCFVRGETAGSTKTYVLANPVVGSVASVPDGNCSPSGQLVKLERIKKATLENINVGTYIEVTGKLERAYGARDVDNPCACKRRTHHDDDSDRHLRELEVADAKEVPVELPRAVALVMPTPAPEVPAVTPPASEPPAVAYAPEAPAPIGTTGVMERKHHKRLPRTASQVPLVGLIGLLALAGGLAVRRLPSQRTV